MSSFIHGFLDELEKVAKKKEKSWLQKNWRKILAGLGVATAGAGIAGAIKSKRLSSKILNNIHKIKTNRSRINQGWSDLEKTKLRRPRRRYRRLPEVARPLGRKPPEFDR